MLWFSGSTFWGGFLPSNGLLEQVSNAGFKVSQPVRGGGRHPKRGRHSAIFSYAVTVGPNQAPKGCFCFALTPPQLLISAVPTSDFQSFIVKVTFKKCIHCPARVWGEADFPSPLGGCGPFAKLFRLCSFAGSLRLACFHDNSSVLHPQLASLSFPSSFLTPPYSFMERRHSGWFSVLSCI